ncbi:carbonic anhydrase [Iamia sp. SCSIO 61187]|uniref:beta-class carbonic anhydrase n=1 Tax=Iamia sp. SCSIO 61187 TaxID=2722752 RepID=UPI001C6353FD|nr:carbonic anhydrase [Iamia sp. SCSIO 61187]QYG92609.1 carbonic anhydrase [Iamia sp. SCSIO 61187]
MADATPDADPFADVWAGNTAYAERFALEGLEGYAARGLTVVTCMDTRIDPLAVLGLAPGDAKIIRSAGARITDNALRSLVLAVHLLGGSRVLLMPHTDCGLVGTDDEVRAKVAAATGRAVDDPTIVAYEPCAIASPSAGLAEDVARIRAEPLLGPDLVVGAAVYDVHTGTLEQVPV